MIDESLFHKLGSPRHVLAPMVDASELAWRMFARRYEVHLTFTPMIHAGMFLKDKVYRTSCLQFCKEDRPLIAQFCANTPETFIKAAEALESFCDAVDLNLGCPQGIAKRGHYGAFLQDDWDLLREMVSQASKRLKVPVTCKIRIFSDVERTVAYAKMLQSAGASMLTVHGRTREMKGPLTGLADWTQIRRVKEELHIPIIANGNIQYFGDVLKCFSETKADAVMSAEGHLHNPAIFMGLQPSVYSMCLEYLEYARIYPSTMSIVRGHVFKLCHHALSEHPDFRHSICLAQNVDELCAGVKALEQACSSCSQNRDASLQHPHWICQPYKRFKTQVQLQAESTLVAASDLAEETVSTNPNKIQLQLERQCRRDAKRARKISRLERKQSSDDALCSNCRSNRRGAHCPGSLCRTCCWKIDPDRSNKCEVHRHQKKRKMA